MYFSQKDPRWSTKKIGFGKMTFAQVACFITSIGNLVDKSPVEINDLAKKCGAFNVDMLNAGIIAKELGYGYMKVIQSPQSVCIAETNYYSKVGAPQHFFLFNPKNGKRVDPLDLEPGWEANNYPIVSYRLFLKLTPEPIPVPIKEVAPLVVEKPAEVNIEPTVVTYTATTDTSKELPTPQETWLSKLIKILISLIQK